jgi:hypothetical protein
MALGPGDEEGRKMVGLANRQPVEARHRSGVRTTEYHARRDTARDTLPVLRLLMRAQSDYDSAAGLRSTD